MIKIEDIQHLGSGLNRAECVLAHRSGMLFVSDWSSSGGVSIISSNGDSQQILSNEKDFTVRPNGIAVENDGCFLLAHLGDKLGGLFRLHPDGALEDVLTEVDGSWLPPSNYIHIDKQGRHWITVSTRIAPRADAYRDDIADGFIVLMDKNGCKIVADQLGYTNECQVHPDGKRLFVNETFGRRLSCFDIQEDGNLCNRRTITEFGHGTYPDGMSFDTRGGIWVTSIISNRLIRVSENGDQEIFIEDVDKQHLDKIEEAFLSKTLDSSHLQKSHSKSLKNISSLAFGDQDLSTIYLGSLQGDSLYHFDSPYTGAQPPHWDAPLEKLIKTLKSHQSY